MRPRVCIIGTGPCGMSALYHLVQLKGDNAPEVVCYEKQSDWGGMWNFSWRIGTDEHGEPNHGSMYKDLWSNGPKEALEIPDYTFDTHFGKPTPSYLPRPVLKKYLEGRWGRKDLNLHSRITFDTVVMRVQYNADTDDFSVWTRNLTENADNKVEKFTHVIVTSGIFSVPNFPSFPGLDSFRGRILHSHDFKDGREFAGQRLLIVGSRYSAEDLALQCKKFGSGRIICTWRTKPMGFKWPEGIEERPLLQRTEGNTAVFKDGSSAEIDAIIFCTGYVYHYPFLGDDLRLKSSKMSIITENLYKGVIWTEGGNKKLLYMGTQPVIFSFTMFDLQAIWISKYIGGALAAPSLENMAAEVKKWAKKNDTVVDLKSALDVQTEYINDLIADVGYPVAAKNANKLMTTWIEHRKSDIASYRDHSFTSLCTGTQAAPCRLPFMQATDDTLF